MATRSTGSKTTTRKSTPAGRKSRTSPTRPGTRSVTATTPETPKTGTKAKATAKAKAGTVAAVAAAPVAVAPEKEDTRFKRPNLIEAVSERTSMKRSDVKMIVELVLDEMGKALDKNEELVLPPLGKVMVKKRQPNPTGSDLLTMKVKRADPLATGTPSENGEGPLAATPKDS